MKGPVLDAGRWRIRHNEIYDIYREMRISEFIRIKRLQWAGHVIRRQYMIQEELENLGCCQRTRTKFN